MEDKDKNLIDDYFNRLLSEAEEKTLLEKTVAESEFGREFALRADMEEWVAKEPGREALATNLAEIGSEFFREEAAQAPLRAGRVQLRRWLLAAASVVLLAVAVWFLNGPKTSLYDQYAQIEPLEMTERGVEIEILVSAAETAFNQKRYAEALDALDDLLTAQPDNAVAELYRGLCLLKLNRPVEARRALESLATGTSALRADAIWYTAMGFLSEGNNADCATWLRRLNAGDAHYNKAQELLGKM